MDYIKLKNPELKKIAESKGIDTNQHRLKIIKQLKDLDNLQVEEVDIVENEKKDNTIDPYAHKTVKREKKELSLSAKKWLEYFKLHFNGQDLNEALVDFKRHKSEKFKYKDELNEIIHYLKKNGE